MIPTRYKSKLPRTLSYPIGAEAISAALAGAPHAEEFVLGFSDRVVWPVSEFQRLLRERLPYRVFVAQYRPETKPGYSAPQSLIEGGWYDCKWELHVYPVLREWRHLVNRLLREQGLPAVVEWLRSSQHAGWGSRHHRIELNFRPAEEAISIQRVDGV